MAYIFLSLSILNCWGADNFFGDSKANIIFPFRGDVTLCLAVLHKLEVPVGYCHTLILRGLYILKALEMSWLEPTQPLPYVSLPLSDSLYSSPIINHTISVTAFQWVLLVFSMNYQVLVGLEFPNLHLVSKVRVVMWKTVPSHFAIWITPGIPEF